MPDTIKKEDQAHDVVAKPPVVTHPTDAVKAKALEFPSPEPSSDPAAFWPQDQGTLNEPPPRDQVYPPTDRQANQGQVAVPETYRTPDGYLVTKHPVANSMATKHAEVTAAHRAMGVTPQKPRRESLDAPSGDLDAQMDSKREEIRSHESAIAKSRQELDAILRHKNRKVE